MAGLDLTSFDHALKTRYPEQHVENMVYEDNPFFALCPKMESFGGRNLVIDVVYGDGQGRSKNFTKAQTRGGATSSLGKAFTLTRTKDYAVATIDNETLEASKGDADAFMSAATTEIDGAINSLTRSLAINLTRDSSAYLGQVLATPSNATTFTVTLKEIQDITNFEVGQNLVVYSAKTGGSQRSSDGSATTFPVVGVNRNTGVLTLTGTYSGSGTMAANDYIFVDGDRGIGVSGLEDWVPASDPTSTSFFGVDRTADVTRLGGLRLDGSALPIEEALIEADAMVCREGQAIDHYFLNHKKFGDLKKALGSKVQYVDLQANAKISFRGIMVDGARGPIKVVADQNFANNRCFGLKLSTWKFYSLGKAVRVIDTDGLQMIRQATADGVEVRYGFYGNLGCKAPGANINIQL